MKRTADTVETLARRSAPEAEGQSQYAIPLGFRKRTLFKMDFAEAVYIAELRTTPAGHTSYRRVAYAMYEAVARKYPALAKYFRVHYAVGIEGSDRPYRCDLHRRNFIRCGTGRGWRAPRARGRNLRARIFRQDNDCASSDRAGPGSRRTGGVCRRRACSRSRLR